jgi:hypothetical protein
MLDTFSGQIWHFRTQFQGLLTTFPSLLLYCLLHRKDPTIQILSCQLPQVFLQAVDGSCGLRPVLLKILKTVVGYPLLITLQLQVNYDTRNIAPSS